ncbi:MAG: hypothetical protein V4726_02800 [Verrucomicrobiota bacterium]
MVAVGLFLYTLTYFIVIKRAPGEIRSFGGCADPAVRLLPYPDNIRSKTLILYRPLIFSGPENQAGILEVGWP